MESKFLKELCFPDRCGIYGIPASAEDFDKLKTRYLRISDISEDGKLLNTDMRSVSSPDIEKYLLEEGDIVFARTGNSTGKSYYHENKNGELAFAGFLIKFSLDPTKVNPKYLRYYTISNHYKEWVENYSLGSTRGNLNANSFGNCLVLLPNREQQDLLVKVLSDLDAKIELNNKINQELEAMAKTLYDYWFVQFDFPAYLSGTLSGVEGYKSSGGKMVYNEELKREIPEGWEVKELDEVSEIKRGTLVTAKTADLEGNIKVVSAGLDYSYLHSESNRERNTITVSSSGANAGFINFWREPIFANDCTTVRGKTDTETLIYLQFLKMRQDHIFKQARGSAQPHVYPKDLSILKIELPNNDLFKLYGEKVLSANEIITNNLKQNQKLAALRDWLLPMLMNGQVTVEDAYVAKEEVLGMVAEDKSFYRKEKE